MYDLIRSKAHEIGSQYCCHDLYFIKCVFLTEENYAFVHSTDQKNCLHASNFAYSSLHFKQERRNWSPRFFNPLPQSALFCTHAHKQINVASSHVFTLYRQGSHFGNIVIRLFNVPSRNRILFNIVLTEG